MRPCKSGYLVASLVVLSLLAGGCAHEAGRESTPAPSWSSRDEALSSARLSRRQARLESGRENDLRDSLEYALEYALEYGLSCALADTLQSPLEEVRKDPLRCGLRAGLEDALEWGLRHILESDQKSAPPDMVQYARRQALDYARKQAVNNALDYALQEVRTDAPAKAALKEVLTKALGDSLEGSLDAALDAALSGAPGPPLEEGPFIWPVSHPNQYITSTFGIRGRAVGGRGRHHAGVDIVTPEGTPIVAVAAGTVIFAGPTNTGYGKLVKIDHGNGLETRYAHLNSFSVQEGETVSCGEQIGEVGRTGHATTAHLHYEVHDNGQPVDPKRYLP